MGKYTHSDEFITGTLVETSKLSKLIRIMSADAAGRTPNCPDDLELAAAADGQLSEGSMQELTLHLADCDSCTAQLGLLKRLHESEPEQQVTEFVLARARRMGVNSKRPAIRHAPRWAAAAVIVLALSLVFNWDLPGPDGSEAMNTAPDLGSRVIEQRQIRNLNLDALGPRVLAPSNGAIVDPGGLVFRWSDIPESLYYDVRIVTDEGDLLWQAQVEDTKLGLPDNLQLNPGTEYFFRVDAYLASAKRVSSQHVLFTIGEQH